MWYKQSNASYEINSLFWYDQGCTEFYIGLENAYAKLNTGLENICVKFSSPLIKGKMTNILPDQATKESINQYTYHS